MKEMVHQIEYNLVLDNNYPFHVKIPRNSVQVKSKSNADQFFCGYPTSE